MRLPRLLIPLASLALSTACPAALDPKDMDLSASPATDFYQYAEGGWVKANPIPADKSSWGSFDELNANNEKVLHGILEKASTAEHPGFIEKLVGDFYASGMDEAAIDAAGSLPLKPLLDRVGAVSSKGQFASLVADLHLKGVGVCFGFGSEQDPKDTANVIAGQSQGGLGLPDRDYYFRDDDVSKKTREKYLVHVAKMLVLIGETEAAAKDEAQAVVRIETALAAGSKKAEELRDPVANYHPMTVEGLQGLSAHFDWTAYLSNLGLAPAPAKIDVGQPEFVRAFDKAIVDAPLQDWQAYFRWHVIHDYAPFLSKTFVAENFAFFAKELTGQPEMRVRWKRINSHIDLMAGDALGQLYVAVAFPPESKARVLAIVSNVRAALRERIEGLPWMDDRTRAAALKKIDALGVKVGYPDKWIDYSKLVIDRGPYAANVLRAQEFGVRRDLAKIGKPTDRTEWAMSPSTVNAYNDILKNEIVFAAGILQPPFFSASQDDAVNYGGIGTVIGHEMTHGFDDEGRQFDEKGNLSEWWTASSAKNFKERAAVIVKQFSSYKPLDGLAVNGELTQGENIADFGGLKIAYSAFEKESAGRPKDKIDGFTPEQRFFLSFASLWRENMRPELTRLYVNTDPHSPSRFRVNGALSNMDEFAAAFGVPEGAPMRRPAAERVSIW